jgi:hypothetical protein
MPDDQHQQRELASQSDGTQYLVGRLSGAVEMLMSRMNRSDDFVDKGFKELHSKMDQKIDQTITPLVTRVTTIEARQGRVAIPATGIGAIVGAVIAAFTSHWLSK